jgi:hypothetical protein
MIETLDDELVVYEATTGRAHRLDPQAARVWRAADGHRTAVEIAAVAGIDIAPVHAALDQLDAGGLLEPGAGTSRRAMLKRSAAFGASALVAVPVVETVLIPTAAAHASTPGGSTGTGSTGSGNGSVVVSVVLESFLNGAVKSYGVFVDGVRIAPGAPYPVMLGGGTLYVTPHVNAFNSAIPVVDYVIVQNSSTTVAYTVTHTNQTVQSLSTYSGNGPYPEVDAGLADFTITVA